MSKPTETIFVPGQINGCRSQSGICLYNCCRQSYPGEPGFGPDNALLLYPGEYESADAETRQHILIMLEDFHGGKLGYCDRDNFDQSRCDANANLKPLDCQSYPFAPSIIKDDLSLLIDTGRCPLPRKSLEHHYKTIIEKWHAAIQKNPAVGLWIRNLNLENYEKYLYGKD